MRRNVRNKKNRIQMQEKSKEKKFISILAFSIVFLIFILLGLFVFTQIKNWNYQVELSKQSEDILSTNIEDANSVEVSSTPETDEPKPITFTLTAIGDVMCHNTQYWDAYQKETNIYDFSYVFNDIKYDIQKGDILEISRRENQIIIEKIDIVKLNDVSKESMENTVVSVARKLDRKSLLMLARRLVEFAEKKEESEIDKSIVRK